VYKKNLELVGMMRQSGVELLAGTDVGNPYCMPGFSLHDELALLVQAGLTPAEALQSATLNPARFLGKEADLGGIAPGQIADLVLLDANPLDDIGNTKRINAVVVNGGLLDRVALDRLLSKVEDTVRSPGLEPKVLRVAPEILNQYTGRYVEGNNSSVVTLEGGQLMLQAFNRKDPLSAESETRFRLQTAPGSPVIEFVKNEQGVVTHFLVNMGGVEARFARQ
jgi:adenine deaminase